MTAFVSQETEMRDVELIRRRYARKAFVVTLLAAGLAASTGAWRLYTEQLALQPQSRLWVEGTSTVRSFTCKASEVKATVEASGGNAVVRVMTGEKAVQTVNVVVPSEKLDCGNGTMNEHMRKAIRTADVPTIAFRVTSYELAKEADGVSGTLTGTLSLGGETRNVSVPATAVVSDGALHVIGAYELAMSDYKLKAPSLMFGRIKVRDKVTVKFDLLLKS
jgi:polyisoprenoid-binding protein YceI